MNKSHRIFAFITLIVTGIAFMGYGATAMDFGFNNFIWSRNSDHSGNLVIGTFSPQDAFYLGAGASLFGFLLLLIGVWVGINNASTLRHLRYIVIGALLMVWGLWGFGWSFYTAEGAGAYKDDTVHIPCPTPNAETCQVDYMQWYYINVGLFLLGLVMMMIALKKSRLTTIRR